MQLREVPPEATRPRRRVLPARLPALVRFAFVTVAGDRHRRAGSRSGAPT